MALSFLSFSPPELPSPPNCLILFAGSGSSLSPTERARCCPDRSSHPCFLLTVMGREARAVHSMLLNKLICYPSILPQAWPCLDHGPERDIGPGQPGWTRGWSCLACHSFSQSVDIYQVPATGHHSSHETQNLEGLALREEPTG